ncbi:MAG TPA: cation:proton antiporter [Tepidisphaeraceae bacterium]|jgi:Kef-type K+ transport system membrane component KefB/nucleotide-binding universal stress UspA family protein|nr:cation:proton antiporter [Tepidisphaeraceae bacterium]
MSEHLLLLLFVQICVIVALSRVIGFLFLRIGQPKVVGEMLAGIMLGPSLLGWLAPHFAAALFPAAGIGYLSFLSQLGVICYLFLVGLELNPKLLRDRGHAAVMISHMSIVAPFLLGAALALYLFPRLFQQTPAMSFRAVALFMGAAMSITAFPVLARILTEKNLHKTNIGAIAITCAAIDDVTAWCMLAFVVALARFQGIHSALMTAVLAVLYVLAMFFIVRPFARRLESLRERQGRLSQGVMAIILLLALASACVTEWIGIHALFGAFLMGAMMPKGTQFVREISEKIEDYTVILLLPIFFAYSGLRTQIGLLNTPGLWLDAGLITLVACLGKFGGSSVGARVCGLSWRDAGAIGALMNTRGLMELVILNIGKDLGVISEAVFAMMILMALITTSLTQPVLNLIYPTRLILAQMARRKKETFSILVPVAAPQSAAALARVAGAMLGKSDGQPPRGSILALHLLRPVEHDAFQSAAGEASTIQNEAIELLQKQLERQRVPFETISFPSVDVPHDIVATAASRDADLVLMGFHKPVFGRALLGGKVHRIMSDCPCDVGVFVDRGFETPSKILVPYGGGQHDRLALELASRIARGTGASVTVLYVAPPSTASAARAQAAREIVNQVFPSTAAVQFQTVEDASPVAVVLREAARFDLVIIGVSEEWGLESRLFGWRPERIARDCPTSMLIVRKDDTRPVESSEGSHDTLAQPEPVAAGA